MGLTEALPSNSTQSLHRNVNIPCECLTMAINVYELLAVIDCASSLKSKGYRLHDVNVSIQMIQYIYKATHSTRFFKVSVEFSSTSASTIHCTRTVQRFKEIFLTFLIIEFWEVFPHKVFIGCYSLMKVKVSIAWIETSQTRTVVDHLVWNMNKSSSLVFPFPFRFFRVT